VATHDPIDITVPNPPPVVTPRLDPGVGHLPPASGGSVQTDGRTVTNSPGPYSVEYARPARDR
jgi:hypothetical protein